MAQALAFAQHRLSSQEAGEGSGSKSKWRISQPGDREEIEADRVAEAVMRDFSTVIGGGEGSGSPVVQRSCNACASSEGICPACAAGDRRVRREVNRGLSPPFIQRREEEEQFDERLQRQTATGFLPFSVQAVLSQDGAASRGDTHEQEADRFGDILTSMPVRTAPVPYRGSWQVGTARHEPLSVIPPFPRLDSFSGADCGDRARGMVDEVVSRSGTPLDLGSRAFFEARLGRDLSAVRVHADGHADESARAVGAAAYTVGNHVVFAADRHRPDTARGRRLLAHELAHVLQQEQTRDAPFSVQREQAAEEVSAPVTPQQEAIAAEVESSPPALPGSPAPQLAGSPTTPGPGTCVPAPFPRAQFLAEAQRLDPGTNYRLAPGRGAPLGLTRTVGTAALPEVLVTAVQGGGFSVERTSTSLPPIHSIYTQAGSFREGSRPALPASQTAGCPSPPRAGYPIRWTITGRAPGDIRAAELEHCSDILTILRVMRHYADDINNRLAGRNFRSERAVGQARTRYGIPANDEIIRQFNCMIMATRIRDVRGWHSPPTGMGVVEPDPAVRGTRSCWLQIILRALPYLGRPTASVLGGCGVPPQLLQSPSMTP